MSWRRRSSTPGRSSCKRQIRRLSGDLAGAVLEQERIRRSQRLATREEVAYLANHAVDARALTERSAKQLIEAIEKNGWAPPE